LLELARSERREALAFVAVRKVEEQLKRLGTRGVRRRFAGNAVGLLEQQTGLLKVVPPKSGHSVLPDLVRRFFLGVERRRAEQEENSDG
jgi:hypothetical protein